MGIVIGAGALDQCLTVLELQEKTPRVWEWTEVRETWAQVTPQTKTNLFSKVGIGARDAAVILRRQPLTLHQAMRWGGRHLFLTAIVPHGRGHLDVSAALVATDLIRLRADGTEPECSFPGVLTEKYLRHAQEWPMSVNELELVLVVPKAIALRPGRLVEARGAAWEILVAHELDEFKNEYEIGRRAEL